MEASDILLLIAIACALFSGQIDRMVKAGGRVRKVLYTAAMIAAGIFTAINAVQLIQLLT